MKFIFNSISETSTIQKNYRRRKAWLSFLCKWPFAGVFCIARIPRFLIETYTIFILSFNGSFIQSHLFSTFYLHWQSKIPCSYDEFLDLDKIDVKCTWNDNQPLLGFWNINPWYLTSMVNLYSILPLCRHIKKNATVARNKGKPYPAGILHQHVWFSNFLNKTLGTLLNTKDMQP